MLKYMKIAIAGYGIEGKASYRYWLATGSELTIVDEREQVGDLPEGVKAILGEGAFSRLEDFDLVVRSPSVDPRKIKTNGKIWSATNEFFANCPNRIIGVTGTKGKGTTCSLIASILEAAGKTVHVVGNIGQPALEVLGELELDDVVVYELSSFQLWDLEASPQVAVVLPIEPDHLDVHSDFDDYTGAKAQIAKRQTADDIIIYHQGSESSRAIAEQSAARKLDYSSQELSQDFIDALRLPGAHNQENARAAILAARAWLPDISDESIKAGLSSFDGLPHRLKFVAEVDGVGYYDDSISTTPGSAIAATKAFSQPKVVILGGSEKGADYGEVVELCATTDTRVVAIGETGRKILELALKHGVDCRYEDSLEAAVLAARLMARAGDVVILSPASASFDMFKNYAERGDRFIAAVEAL